MQASRRKLYRMTRLHRKLQREEQESQLTEEWRSAVKLEEIVIPDEFKKTPAMRLWYLARCDAQGQFMTNVIDLNDPSLQMAHDPWSSSMYSPWNRLLRRIRIAAQLAPLIFPNLVELVWDTAGLRLLVQFAAEIAFGLLPAWGTWSQGQLVDAVQKSLYSRDVARDIIIRYTVISLIASNVTPVANSLLSRNASLCQRTLGTKLERINLRLHLDMDIPSLSNPVVNVLLRDASAFVDPLGAGGGYSSSFMRPGWTSVEIAQFSAIISTMSTIVNIISSLALFFTNFKFVLEFGVSLSSALFLVLACWPLFGNHLTRRGHIQAAKSEQQQAWLERSAKARTFSQIGTSFLYKQEVLLFGLRDWVLDNWEKYRIQSQELNPLQANNQFVHLLTMTQIPFNVVKDITHALLGLHFFSEKITLGSLHVVQTTTSSIYYQTTGLRHQIESVVESILYMTAFFELQRWVNEKGTGGRTIEYKPAIPVYGDKRGMAIEAKNLTFAYPGTNTPVLKNVNLKIEAGQTLAIVGFNGGGKTTLAKILTGLFDYEGSLQIDGVEASKYTRESLHKYTTVTPQNFCQFPLTIKDNIGVGLVEMIDDLHAIREAARKGGAEEVLKNHGMNGMLGSAGVPGSFIPRMAIPEEDGEEQKPEEEKEDVKGEEKIGKQEQAEVKKSSKESQEPKSPQKKEFFSSDPRVPPPGYQASITLSGGEAQRVALARSFMRADEATLVVFDEPSASLDARAEHELFQRIHRLSHPESGNNTRTTVYISHRFSTVRRADKIAVVEDGTITELGSHAELMALDGRYAEFFTLQAQAFSN